MIGCRLLTLLGISLGMTLVIELIVAVVSGKRDRKDLLLVCLVNAMTNPVVVLAYYLANYYTTLNLALLKIFLEIIAVLVEAYYYKTYGKGFRHPFGFSVCANLFSFGIGAVLNALW